MFQTILKADWTVLAGTTTCRWSVCFRSCIVRSTYQAAFIFRSQTSSLALFLSSNDYIFSKSNKFAYKFSARWDAIGIRTHDLQLARLTRFHCATGERARWFVRRVYKQPPATIPIFYEPMAVITTDRPIGINSNLFRAHLCFLWNFSLVKLI